MENRGIKFLITFFFVLIAVIYGQAQDRCGTVEYLQKLRDQRVLRENDQDFEDWLSRKITPLEMRTSASQVVTYSIPLVVHIIHKGEAIGVGTNISEAQIISQINVLNKDFNRLNADTTNTPLEFQSIAGKINIEFVLAKQTVDGLSTNGILRVKGTKNQWSTSDDATLKALSYWPAEDYLNIWVTDLSSTLLGYAQFPVSDLAGLEDAEDNRLTDGVVVDYTTFGSIDDGPFNLTSNFNKGRTATHEIGHFFGLRHIWGDDNGSCSGRGDYVADTPNQGDNTEGCPANPQTSCSVQTMFQNYMDYTNDGCMNLFTQDQVSRMTTVLENSPRRVTLLSSPGLDDPNPVANDLSINEILVPADNACKGSVVPSIRLRNHGTNTITSAKIQLTVNTVTETRTINFAPALGLSQETLVEFSAQALTSGSYTFGFQILETNGTTDGKVSNNTRTITTLVPQSITLPFSEYFNTLPLSWAITNPDESTTWAIRTAPKDNTSNKAIYMNFYEYEDAESETDVLTTPVFDLSTTTAPYLIFDVAYMRYQESEDGLKVYILTGCQRLSEGTEVYSKSGSSLATASSTSSSFVPAGEGQWRRESIDLSRFIGYTNVQVAFVGINDVGNNLYLDNISVVSNITENIALKKVISPTPVHCNNEVKPVLVVENTGTVPITGFKINYTLNNGSRQIATTGAGLNLAAGAQAEITLPAITLANGLNSLTFELTEPNALIDIDPSDNQLQTQTLVNAATDLIPLRQNFGDSDYTEQWSIINPSDGMTWQPVTTNYDRSLFFNAFENSTIGDEAWLVSPTLDFSNISTASVFFDLSYRFKDSDGNRDVVPDNFRVLASKDCGNTFDEILFNEGGKTLSNITQMTAWIPAVPDEWVKNYVNLNTLAGAEQVRIAFVVTNGNGNNLYIDNIEFFVSDNPTPLAISDSFAVYGTDPGSPTDFYITFNLTDRQAVVYELVDMMGKQIAGAQLEEVLNQTYVVDASAAATGIYILRLRIGNKYYAAKVYVGN